MVYIVAVVTGHFARNWSLRFLEPHRGSTEAIFAWVRPCSETNIINVGNANRVTVTVCIYFISVLQLVYNSNSSAGLLWN